MALAIQLLDYALIPFLLYARDSSCGVFVTWILITAQSHITKVHGTTWQKITKQLERWKYKIVS